MTNEEILRVVRECGDDIDHTLPSDKAFLIAFAERIAQRTQEECAAACDDGGIESGRWYADKIRGMK